MRKIFVSAVACMFCLVLLRPHIVGAEVDPAIEALIKKNLQGVAQILETLEGENEKFKLIANLVFFEPKHDDAKRKVAGQIKKTDAMISAIRQAAQSIPSETENTIILAQFEQFIQDFLEIISRQDEIRSILKVVIESYAEDSQKIA